MIPVGPLITAINEVAGQDEEVHARMPMRRGLQEPPPAFQSGLRIPQVEETQRTPPLRRGLHDPPRAPTSRRPVTDGISIDAIRLEPAHVNVIVRGPQLVLAKLDLHDAVYVDADGMVPGSYDSALQISLPDGIQLVHKSAMKVKLRIYREKRITRP